METVRLEKITRYDKSDTKMYGESVVDFLVDDKYIYREEDWYHNKINSKIEGFIDCLKTLNIPYTLVEKSVADGDFL